MSRAAQFCAVLIPLLVAAGIGGTVRFVDRALESGIHVPNTYGGKHHQESILESTGTGVAIFDFDEDGAEDIFIANGTAMEPGAPPTPSQLYHNDGKGHFVETAASAGLTRTGWAQAACAGDFDNDGHIDLFVTYYGHNTLYRNLGSSKFQDVTAASGLPVGGIRWGSGCAFVDYDRDGFLDIFVSNYIDLDLSKASGSTCQWLGIPVWCGPHGLPPARNALYHNNRDGTFTDVSESAGILAPGARYGLGVAVADFDNDGWPDIYVACDQMPSLLYHNLGNGKFEDRADVAGVAYNADGRLQSGMGVAVADFDENGFLDLVKTNFSGDRPSLYKNVDGKFFEDVSEHAGLGAHQLLGWGVAFLDVDDDGWPDLVMANGHVYTEVDRSAIGERFAQPTLLYRNLGTGKFADISAQAGPAFAPPRPSRGLATGDLDGDGRPEIVIVNMNQAPAVLKNEGARQNGLAVRLTGVRSNRSAIGARCTIEAGGKRQMQEVMSGGSYYSQNSLTLYFGLGRSQGIDSMVIRWPSGAAQKWSRLAGNRTLLITEGSEEVKSKAWIKGSE
jgi:enediyne biosynthesis protein E4